MALDQCIWPQSWQLGTSVPLFKAGSKLSPDNYRLLSLTSACAKLFELIIDVRIRKWAESRETLSDLQGGFRAGRSTADQLFILTEILAHRSERKGQTFMAFLDVSKAYDTVWRDGLWYKLCEMGVGGKCLKFLRKMYSKVRRSVVVNGKRTE